MATAIPAAKAAQISYFESKAKLCTEIGRLCAHSAQGYIRNVAGLDAEDVAQELVLRLLNKKRLKRARKGWCLVDHRNQPVGPLKAHIWVATKNLCRDLVQSENCRTARGAAFNDAYGTIEPCSAEDRLQGRQVLAAMRPQDRAVLIESVVNGTEGRSAAERKRLSRARRALHDIER